MTLNSSSPRLPVLVTVGVLVAAFAGGCGTFHSVGQGPRLCAVMDSLYEDCGFGDSLMFVGKATVDANQYQVRGVVRLETDSAGNVYFEFRNSLLFGSRVEDFFVSLVDDTLRIMDRERGRLFVGRDAEQVLAEDLGMEFDVRQALDLVLGGHAACAEISDLEINPDGGGEIRGHVEGSGFRVDFEPSGRIERAEWPVPGDASMDDRLLVDYEWKYNSHKVLRLDRVVIHLQEREWRCKLASTSD
jgi:hypothetical protein